MIVPEFADYSFLEGAVDLHIHTGPDYVKRYADSIDLAREAAAAGMRAIILKTHLVSTVAGAYAADRVVEEVRVFGGIALNDANGCFNLRNVAAALKSGGKMIWMPTVDAAYALDKAKNGHWIGHYVNGSVFGYPRNALTVLDDAGNLKDDVREIVRLCREYDAILGTGHLSPSESLKLAREAKDIGYDKLEVTHPNAWLEDFTIPVMKELAALGATMTLSYGVCSPHNGRQDPAEIVQVVKEVGADHCCLITDYGQVASPSPVEGFRVFCQLLNNLGVSRDEIDRMAKTNPARLLAL